MASSIRTATCSQNRGVVFSLCQGTADEIGTPACSHSIVEGTTTRRLRLRSMYSTTSGPTRVARPNAAGAMKLIAPPAGQRGRRGFV